MLAKISEGIPDAIKQLKGEPFLAEYKYDGTRAQIHLLPDNSVKVFSRNCEDKTASMPDVVAAIQAAAKGILHLAFVFDCNPVGCLQSKHGCKRLSPPPPPATSPPQVRKPPLCPLMQSKVLVFMCACLPPCVMAAMQGQPCTHDTPSVIRACCKLCLSIQANINILIC